MVCNSHSVSSRSFRRVFTPSPNKVPSGSTTAARPPGLSELDDQHQEQVCGLAGAELTREIVLNAVLLHAAKRRIGQHHVNPVAHTDVAQGPSERVVVPNAGRHINTMHDHVGGTQQVRQGLLLHALNAGLKLRLLRWRLHVLLANVLNGAGQKSRPCRKPGRGPIPQGED